MHFEGDVTQPYVIHIEAMLRERAGLPPTEASEPEIVQNAAPVSPAQPPGGQDDLCKVADALLADADLENAGWSAWSKKTNWNTGNQ